MTIEENKSSENEFEKKEKSTKNSIGPFVYGFRNYAFSNRIQKLSDKVAYLNWVSHQPAMERFLAATTSLKAHIACAEQYIKLPRFINVYDEQIQYSNLQGLLIRQSPIIGIPKIYRKPGQRDDVWVSIRTNYYLAQHDFAQSYLKTMLFENAWAIKLSQCSYRDRVANDFVNIYIHPHTGIFAVVLIQYTQIS